MLNVLVLAEHFPNTIQPWLLNWLEEILRHGGMVEVCSLGRLEESIPEKVVSLGLLERTEYFPLQPLGSALKRVTAFVWPFGASGKRAYGGLRKLRLQFFRGPHGPKEALKAVLRSSILVPGEFDVIHSHTLGMSYEFLFVARALDIPLITTFHGLPPAGVRQLSSERLAEVFALGKRFLVNTRFAKAQLESLGCPPGKIVILPQGTKLQEFPFVPRAAPADGRIILLTVGRLHLDKGHAYALEAVKELVQRGFDIEYRLVGAGPEMANLRQWVADHQLEQHVVFLGLIDEGQLRQQYQQAHVFLLPSLRDKDGVHEETQGVVIQEAQASGALVICTRTGGIPECVTDGENAFLVPDRDALAIEQKVEMVLSQPERWAAWQRNARAHVEQHYAIERLGDAMWQLYGDVIAEQRQQPSR